MVLLHPGLLQGHAVADPGELSVSHGADLRDPAPLTGIWPVVEKAVPDADSAAGWALPEPLAACAATPTGPRKKRETPLLGEEARRSSRRR